MSPLERPAQSQTARSLMARIPTAPTPANCHRRSGVTREMIDWNSMNSARAGYVGVATEGWRLDLPCRSQWGVWRHNQVLHEAQGKI